MIRSIIIIVMISVSLGFSVLISGFLLSEYLELMEKYEESLLHYEYAKDLLDYFLRNPNTTKGNMHEDLKQSFVWNKSDPEF